MPRLRRQIVKDDDTGHTGVLKTWDIRWQRMPPKRLGQYARKLIEARSVIASSTGRIYGSKPVPVISREMPCKRGGDHIRISGRD